MFVLDSHCDTPSQMVRGLDVTRRNRWGDVDFPRLREGKVDAAFFALYVPAELPPRAATEYALTMRRAVREALRKSPRQARLVRSSEEALRCKEEGRFALFLSLENASPIRRSLTLLRRFYQSGVRLITLVHNGDNALADSAAGTRTWGGLSPFGRRVVAEMNRLGMVVDIAHASDETFWDALSCSKAPIVSSHSCCRALAGHRRNLTDDMLRALAEKGGVCQVNFYPVFLSDAFSAVLDASGLDTPETEALERAWIADPGNRRKHKAWQDVLSRLAALPRPGVDRIVDHIDHIVEVAGIEAVGLGSDFDGIGVKPAGLDDVSRFPAVFEEMRRRGYGEKEIEAVAGGNFLRVLRRVEALSGR